MSVDVEQVTEVSLTDRIRGVAGYLADQIDPRVVAKLRAIADEVDRLRAENAALVAGFNADGLTAADVCCGKIKQGLRADVAKLREALGFFASVIKSGEPWTSACQYVYDNALRATTVEPS